MGDVVDGVDLRHTGHCAHRGRLPGPGAEQAGDGGTGDGLRRGSRPLTYRRAALPCVTVPAARHTPRPGPWNSKIYSTNARGGKQGTHFRIKIEDWKIQDKIQSRSPGFSRQDRKGRQVEQGSEPQSGREHRAMGTGLWAQGTGLGAQGYGHRAEPQKPEVRATELQNLRAAEPQRSVVSGRKSVVCGQREDHGKYL